eukprot:6802956-Alexandrium_andersonii.AAC.1
MQRQGKPSLTPCTDDSGLLFCASKKASRGCWKARRVAYRSSASATPPSALLFLAAVLRLAHRG